MRLSALLVLTACQQPWMDLSDTGYACIVEQGADFSVWSWYDTTTGTAPDALSAGRSEVVVVISDCYSSSVTDEQATCSASDDGATIDVVSEAGWHKPGGSQNSDCNVLSTRCAGPDLTDGPWTLSYAGETVDFDVPSAETPCTR
ncbi:MAG: hypothetical protein H6735_19255 [Alphaproteobacteria bacterium]|nr:hypothetical protein [Alphaproteobacteria bacterium]